MFCYSLYWNVISILKKMSSLFTCIFLLPSSACLRKQCLILAWMLKWRNMRKIWTHCSVSKNAKCTTNYTAHCLRATAIQCMNDAGFEIRHIMHMSGHESSVRSYNRNCSTDQKKATSDSLASCFMPVSNESQQVEQPLTRTVQFNASIQ